ncbi:hypothetical protein LSPH24S_06064 [Lysinibacillus sphaericus]
MGKKLIYKHLTIKKCYIVFAENVMPNPELTKNLSIISKPNRSATHHTYNSDKLNGIFISSFKLKESSIKSNTEVKSIILKKMRGKNMSIKISVIGKSGVGKSTFSELAQKFFEEKGCCTEIIKII